MIQSTYIKEFNEYYQAHEFMCMKNKACERAGNKNDIFCLVPGPADNFAVVDLVTGIDLQMGYIISYSGYVENPF